MDDDDTDDRPSQEYLLSLTPREIKILRARFGHSEAATESLDRLEAEVEKSRQRLMDIAAAAVARGRLPGTGDTRMCSFCHQPEEAVTKLIESDTGPAICDECLLACAALIKKESKLDSDD